MECGRPRYGHGTNKARSNYVVVVSKPRCYVNYVQLNLHHLDATLCPPEGYARSPCLGSSYKMSVWTRQASLITSTHPVNKQIDFNYGNNVSSDVIQMLHTILSKAPSLLHLAAKCLAP